MATLKQFWEMVVSWYVAYSDFVHSIFPSQVGDLVVYIIDILVIIIIIKVVADAAFGTKNNG